MIPPSRPPGGPTKPFPIPKMMSDGASGDVVDHPVLSATSYTCPMGTVPPPQGLRQSAGIPTGPPEGGIGRLCQSIGVPPDDEILSLGVSSFSSKNANRVTTRRLLSLLLLLIVVCSMPCIRSSSIYTLRCRALIYCWWTWKAHPHRESLLRRIVYKFTVQLNELVLTSTSNFHMRNM